MPFTLTAEADAFVCDGDVAGQNFGGSIFSDRAVGKQNAFTGLQVGRQLYRFNLPGGLGTIVSATLRVKVYDNFAGFPHATAVYGCDDAWGEMTVTWNTQPAVDSGELGSVLATCCGNVYTYDVTAYVQAQITAAQTQVSFQQRGQNETVVGGVRWWQREGDGISQNLITGEAPQLLIDGDVVPVEATTWGEIKSQY
jgi:hypothetical protein